MNLLRAMAGNMTLFCALLSPAYAGPCSDDIARTEGQVSTWLDALAMTGPDAPQDATAFGKHLQPSPRSIATAEEKLHELSQQRIDAVRQAMERARAADAAGDKSACEQALADVGREIRQP
jgi:hypothetical protein